MRAVSHSSQVFLCVLCALCGSISRAQAQSRQIPAPPQNHPVIIHDATIHPVSEPPIDRGYIIFEKGVITHIGPGMPPAIADRDAISLDGRDLHVYPGLILPSTYLGLTEIGDIEQTNDHTELGRVKPEVRAAPAINPDSDLIPVTRANGILTGLVMPRGGLISGRASSIRFDGWTWEDMTIDDAAGLCINWPRMEPVNTPWMQRSEEDQRREMTQDLDAIDKIFDEAGAYLAAKDADDETPGDLRYEAMRAAIAGEKPIFISANLASQIESAVAWSVRRKLKAVIVGGAQADRCSALLKKHDVPLIITGTHRLPTRRHEAHDAPYALPARLAEAGVRFCLATGDEAAHERNLNHMAATAAAYGLSPQAALRSVTLSSAQIIGVGEKLGSLEIGKSATLIITTGDPLEITTDTIVAFIDGRRIDLGNRQKALHSKYQQKYRQLDLLEDDETRALGAR